MNINLPSPEDRTIIIGRTGSGKTQFGLWLLSEMNYDEMPWIIIDYKGDPSIRAIPYAQSIAVGEIPSEPGIYVARPMHTQSQEMEDYLYAIWQYENVGLYVDEGVMLSKNAALDTILIQGRSKRIPVIVLSQRPVGISRFAFSEAQFIVVFPSHDKREQKIVSEFAPLFQEKDSGDELIPTYHSWYYDVKNRSLKALRPVPSLDRIMQTFDDRLAPEDDPEQVPLGTPELAVNSRKFREI